MLLRILAIAFLAAIVVTGPAPIVTSVAADRVRGIATPFFIEANHGQYDSEARFAARSGSYDFRFTDHGVRVADSEVHFTMRFAEANVVRPRAEAPQAGRVSYFRGSDASRWLTDIPTFGRLRYAEVWNGIDVLFYGAAEQLEYDVVVSPGASVESARIVFDGADTVSVSPSGELIVKVGTREVRYSSPVAYQNVGGERKRVPAQYIRRAATTIGFEAGPYDATIPLVIDPVLIFSTFTGAFAVSAVEVDAAGNVYAADTRSNSAGGQDGCVTKLPPGGGSIVYRACIGAMSPSSIAIDAAGAAYVVGTTGWGFPTTTGAFQRMPGGGIDGGLVKFSPGGNLIVYATLLAGNGDDFASEQELSAHAHVEVDATGHAYVAGITSSSNFPTTAGAYSRTFTAPAQGVALKLNPSGTALIYGTYLGKLAVGGLELDATNRAVIVGHGNALTAPTIPTPSGWGGDFDAVIMKLNASGSGLVFSRIFGGSGFESADALALTPEGTIVFTGGTNSGNLPAAGPLAGDYDVYIAELSASGQTLLQSRTFGGSGPDYPTALAATAAEFVVVGSTESPNLPPGAGPPEGRYDPTYAIYDAFIARFDRGGQLLSSTYFGGDSFEQVFDGVVDGAGRLTFGGYTQSSDFPLRRQLPGPRTGEFQGFLAQFAAIAPGSVSPYDQVVHVANAPDLQLTGNWQVVNDPTAASGKRVYNPDAGWPRPAAPLAAPADYIEFTVRGLELGPYRMWVRGKAQNNSYSNDSVWVQFSYAADNFPEEGGRQVYAIGSAQALPIIIEDCSGCNVRGWGWQDSGYGRFVLGPLLYFDDSRETRIRIQRREDGISIDQIVFSKIPDGPFLNPYGDYPPGYQHDDTTILAAPTGGGADEIVLYTGVDNPQLYGGWRVVDDPTAAGGKRITHPDAGAAKIAAPLATPTHYVDLQFVAQADVLYSVWVRLKAARDDPYSDSVYLQFGGQIGSTGGMGINLETCSGVGLQGWGWRNAQWCGSGPVSTVMFSTDGPQTVRIQTREDGVSVDQIVLSTTRFAAAPPGPPKNDSTIVTR